VQQVGKKGLKFKAKKMPMAEIGGRDMLDVSRMVKFANLSKPITACIYLK
jgi:hypothetical protein